MRNIKRVKKLNNNMRWEGKVEWSGVKLELELEWRSSHYIILDEMGKRKEEKATKLVIIQSTSF